MRAGRARAALRRGACGALVACLAAMAASAALRAQVTRDDYAARRVALAGLLPRASAVIVLGAPEPARDYDGFSPAGDLRYFTGWDRPEGALILVTDTTGVATQWFFAPPRSASAEVWTGPRLTLAQVREATGIEARDLADVRPVVDSLLGAGRTLAVIGDFTPPQSSLGTGTTRDMALLQEWRGKAGGDRVTNGTRYALLVRAGKRASEIAQLRRAIDLTVRAHQEVAAQLEPGWREFEVQALVEYTFRRNGAERTGFATIAGSGDNATTLHYNRNDRRTQPGELLVLDIGAAWNGYSADVTRTWPVSGRFSPPQREIYQLVRDAQRAAESAIAVGARYRAASDSASIVLARGLTRLGLIEAPDATYDCDARGARRCAQLGLYYMHGLGHPIGLSVHDVDSSAVSGTWRAGSVFTLEPGVYVRRALGEAIPDTERNRALLQRIAPALATYAGTGVRIEDDYLLTERGLEWLSPAPREVDEVERALAAPRARSPRARDAALVERYERSLPEATPR
ncbi:MAG: Xaa-Pro aminopeptidase [Gemmatimonadaceae bacterium]|nr:Xaa-Pro aminopeptidase [Gemmatimonadaceae bacterium]